MVELTLAQAQEAVAGVNPPSPGPGHGRGFEDFLVEGDWSGWSFQLAPGSNFGEETVLWEQAAEDIPPTTEELVHTLYGHGLSTDEAAQALLALDRGGIREDEYGRWR